jgi:mono/diheme cytochrome c family protein
VTEVPEHLLARSRERRKALGLAGGSDGESSAEASAPAASAPAAASSAPATVAPAGAPAAAAAPPPAPVEEKPVPTYLRPEAKKGRMPVWVMPVLAALPFWGILYMGAFGERAHEEALTGAALGAQVYRAQGCGSCHGGAGEGGVGPALAGGEAALTFPEEADHVEWIKTGSAPFRGQPYGAEDRPGGQRTATGGMPGFPSLSDEEIQAVVLYEREEL